MRLTRAWRTTSFSPKRATPTPSTPFRICKRLVQARRRCPPGRSLCDGSPVTTMRESSPRRVSTIFIWARRGVLRLVQNDEGARQRAAAHEGERRHFDHALFHQPARIARPGHRTARRRAGADRDRSSLSDRRAGSPAVRPLPAPGATGSAARPGAHTADARRRPPQDRSCRCPPVRRRRPADASRIRSR